jgi:hypothetical protein
LWDTHHRISSIALGVEQRLPNKIDMSKEHTLTSSLTHDLGKAVVRKSMTKAYKKIKIELLKWNVPVPTL